MKFKEFCLCRRQEWTFFLSSLSAVFRGNQFSSICGNVVRRWELFDVRKVFLRSTVFGKCTVVKIISMKTHIFSHIFPLSLSRFYNADSLIFAFSLAFSFFTSSFIQFPQTAREKSVFIKKFSFVVLGVC